MATLTFDSVEIFGATAKFETERGNPTRSRFDRGFPGVDETVRLDLGRRTRSIVVTGNMVGTFADIKSQVAVVEGKDDGNAYTLVITLAGSSDTYQSTTLDDFSYGPGVPYGSAKALMPFRAVFTQLREF